MNNQMLQTSYSRFSHQCNKANEAEMEMNMQFDLEKLSLPELKKLQKDVEKAISTFEERKKSEARAELEAKAKELGFSLNQLLDDAPTKKKSAPVKPKYRNPANPDQTWSGRGRKPNWLTDALANKGAKLEDFAI
jgi:DNA-binding protein H-NS